MEAVACPLCRSDQVHQVSQKMDLTIYLCDACKAQFTVQIPRTRRVTLSALTIRARTRDT